MRRTVTSAPFAGEADERQMRDFLVAAAADRSVRSYHVGDLTWGLYQNTVFDPTANMRLWRDEGNELLGFAWFHEPASVDLQLHPRLRGQEWLEAEMLAWADERRLACAAAAGGEPRPLETIPFEPDQATADALRRLGFVPGEPLYLHLERGLADPIPPPVPPAGFVVRHVAEETEFDERVAIHRGVWHPSKVTLDAYRRMRTIAGYDPELDLVAWAADGTAAAYCICWLDPVNRTGLFEPVGTREAFRGRGLGKAVMREGLRRLRGRGARTAIVGVAHGNEAAIALYASVGFRTIGVFRSYTRSG